MYQNRTNTWTVVSSIFVGINFWELNENHSFKDKLIHGDWSYECNSLLKIAIQFYTFNFVDQLSRKIHENLYSTTCNTNENTV